MSVQVPSIVDLRKYIDTQFFGPRPHIRGRRVPVAMIARRAQVNGWTVTEAAYNFTLSESEILAALLYYHEHQADLDAQEEEEIRLFDEMKRKHGGG